MSVYFHPTVPGLTRDRETLGIERVRRDPGIRREDLTLT